MALSKQMIPIKTIGAIAYEERDAGESGILPGMLCMVDADGDVIKHNSEGAPAECLVAVEDALQGKGVDTAYTTDYPVRLQIFRPGEEFHGILEAGSVVTRGERLMSAGNGKFESRADSGQTTDTVLAYAMEDEDLSDGSDTLVHMRAG